MLERVALADSICDVDDARLLYLSIDARLMFSRTPLCPMSRVTPFAHTPTPAGQIRAPARRPCWARDRLGRATVAFVSGREAERLGMKQLLSLCLFVRFSLFLRRPLGTRAHMTDKKSACLWARHTSSNPGRGNHRTPPRALRLVSGFSEKSTQMTCQKSSTILRNIQPLFYCQLTFCLLSPPAL